MKLYIKMQTFELVNWELAIPNRFGGHKPNSSQQYLLLGTNIHSIYLDVDYLTNPNHCLYKEPDETKVTQVCDLNILQFGITVLLCSYRYCVTT